MYGKQVSGQGAAVGKAANDGGCDRYVASVYELLANSACFTSKTADILRFSNLDNASLYHTHVTRPLITLETVIAGLPELSFTTSPGLNTF